MITNERQYRITLAQAEKFAAALEAFEGRDEDADPILRRAEREALQSQYDDLLEQVREYDRLRAGDTRHLAGRSIESIAGLMITARIAAGLTQRDLALRLGMKEQQVQRYEADRYRSASLFRIGEVCRALDLDVAVLVSRAEPMPDDFFTRYYDDTAVISE